MNLQRRTDQLFVYARISVKMNVKVVAELLMEEQ